MDAKLDPKKTAESTNSCGLLSTASTSKMCKKQLVVESVRPAETLSTVGGWQKYASKGLGVGI